MLVYGAMMDMNFWKYTLKSGNQNDYSLFGQYMVEVEKEYLHALIVLLLKYSNKFYGKP